MVDGTAFGRYRLLSLIGEGGMGKVYRAHDTAIGRDVAIKVLSSELGAAPGYRERFRREAHTAARLTEPHIIPVHDTGEIDGHLYLVMPVVNGIDLHTLLARYGPMSPQRAVNVIEQLAAALNAAHQHGLVHRDVKPANALLTGDDFVYLIDFGIAHDSAASRLTSVGMIVGTPAYMAPERFTTGIADARADIYALACVLHECLTGATPYPGNSMEQQIAGHLTLDPPKPASLNPVVPPAFNRVIATGMAKLVDHRYQSARDLATAARQALTEASPDRAAATRIRVAGQPSPLPPPVPDTVRLPIRERYPSAVPPKPAGLIGGHPPAEHPVPWPATPPPAPPPAPPGRRPGHLKVALIAAAVVIVAAGAGIIIYLRQPQPTPAPAAAQSAASQHSGSSTVAQASLEGLLLSPPQINTAMAAASMIVTGSTATVGDSSANVADTACLPMQGPAEATAYAGSGWSAVVGQALKEPGNPWIHGADQYVVLFSSANDAKAFFATSAERWPACANRQYHVTFPGQPDHLVVVGPVSNIDGVLSAPQTFKAGDGGIGNCQRALTVVNNVAIDIATCFNNFAAQSDSAVNIARQIAAKVSAL